MSNGLSISKHVRISKGGTSINGDAVLPELAGQDVKELAKALYKQLVLDYPKFFKMDSLCQLAFIAAELLLKDSDLLSCYPKENIAVLLSNSASSLDTDRRYHDTIKDPDKYFPSPAVFVYTLPNIMNGEITIRHGITGENSFFLSESFEAAMMVSAVEELFQFTDTQACISGWVNVDGERLDALMYLVEKGEGMEFTSVSLLQLF